MNVLHIKGLTKYYGRITALDHLDLSVESGMIFGLLGPNGSGKTTTLGIILGIIRPSEGQFRWFEDRYGANPRRRIGALLETPNFYPYLSAADNLELIAHIKKSKNPRIGELLELVKLSKRMHSRYRTFSLGMKQRLAIAAALIGDPEVLILDEPTNGLDPQGIAEVRETIIAIGKTGKTILMASHILDEVEKVCSDVAIIKNGALLAQGTVGSILTKDVLIEVSAAELGPLRTLFHAHESLTGMEEKDGKLILHFGADISPADINRLAFEKGISLTHLVRRQQSLEAEFLQITKEYQEVS